MMAFWLLVIPATIGSLYIASYFISRVPLAPNNDFPDLANSSHFVPVSPFPPFNLSSGLILSYSPSSLENVQDLMGIVKSMGWTSSLIPFEKEIEMDNMYKTLSESSDNPLMSLYAPFFGVSFEKVEKGAGLQYKIKLPKIQMASENPSFGDHAASYVQSGFLSVQLAIENAMARYVLFNTTTNVSIPKFNVSTALFPEKNQLQVGNQVSRYYSIFHATLWTAIALGCPLIFSVSTTIVGEKERKLFEVMKLNGMYHSSYYSASFLSHTLLICGGVFLYAGYLVWPQIWAEAHYVVVVFFLFQYCWSVIALGIFFSSFFTKAKVGSVASIFLLLTLSAGSIFFVDSWAPLPLKYLLSLIPPMAHTFTFARVAIFEQHRQIIDPFANDIEFQMPSVFFSCLMMSLDILFYTLAAWYVEELSVGHPWAFPFSLNYWGLKKPQPNEDTDSSVSSLELENLEQGSDIYLEQPGFEENPPVIQIRDLRKEYDGSVAVDDLSLDIFEGEVLSLLGSNGAGKTTTVSMLTGTIKATAGDALVYGSSINSSLPRNLVGLCPQHDVLWPQLSLNEHLILFSILKGVPPRLVKPQVEKLEHMLGLEDRSHVRVSKLSGGQQRRVSVGIAYCGDSKVVFLDEPTAGLDPHARRHIWSIVAASKEDRAIILTTHYLDEADVLGDRIAIMTKGKLRAHGSPLGMKRTLGGGYTLVVLKNQANQDDSPIVEFVQTHIPEAKMRDSSAGAELSLILPIQSTESFHKLLSGLENSKENLQIRSFGISMASLEDVFMNTVLSFEPELKSSMDGLDLEKAVMESHQSSSWIPTFPFKLFAMIKKRALILARDRGLFLMTFVFPTFLMLLVAILQMIAFNAAKKVDEPFEISIPARFPHFQDSVFPTFPSNSTTLLRTVFGDALHPFPNREDVISFLTDHQPDQSPSYAGVGFFDIGSFLIFANNSAIHAFPSMLSAISTAIIRNVSNNPGFDISLSVQPFQTDQTMGLAWLSILFGCIICLSWAFISGSFAVGIVQEKHSRTRDMQLVSGGTKSLYWISNFLWDSSWSLVFSLISCGFFFLFNWSHYSPFFWVFLASMTAYAVFSIPQIYCLSFLFKNTGTVHITIASMLIAPAMGFLMAIISISGALSPAHVSAYIVSFVACACSPLFGLIRANFFILDTMFMRSTWELEEPGIGIWEWKMLGMSLFLSAANFVGWFILLGFIEFIPGCCARLCWLGEKCGNNYHKISSDGASYEEDIDVKAERERVLSRESSTIDEITIKKLRKVWKKEKVAVKDLTLGIPAGETFGLLGANAAGKTTTLNILSGALRPTSGTAYLDQINVRKHPGKVQRIVGICPQFDALFATLTVKEHLSLYGNLRGVKGSKLNKVAASFIEALHLTRFQNRKAAQLSGGNRRKLSLAIALIGDPPIVMLDEPSTGMDPAARRFMWNSILQIAKQRAVILTTHSMIECDALCSRVGIMKEGVLECLGSTQHLKSRFGEGYTVDVLVSHQGDPESLASTIQNLLENISDEFPSTRLIEQRGKRLTLGIAAHSLPKVFQIFSSLHKGGELVDFGVSQTTLEQVFLQIVSNDVPKGINQPEEKSSDNGDLSTNRR